MKVQLIFHLFQYHLEFSFCSPRNQMVRSLSRALYALQDIFMHYGQFQALFKVHSWYPQTHLIGGFLSLSFWIIFYQQKLIYHILQTKSLWTQSTQQQITGTLLYLLFIAALALKCSVSHGTQEAVTVLLHFPAIWIPDTQCIQNSLSPSSPSLSNQLHWFSVARGDRPFVCFPRVTLYLAHS